MSCPHATRLLEIGQGGEVRDGEKDQIRLHLHQGCAECEAQLSAEATHEAMVDAMDRLFQGETPPYTKEQQERILAGVKARLGKPEGRG